MLRKWFSKLLKIQKGLYIDIYKLNTEEDTVAYKHQSYLIFYLFGFRIKQDVSHIDIWVGEGGLKIPDSLRQQATTVNISYICE
jgi:hypothetical protein